MKKLFFLLFIFKCIDNVAQYDSRFYIKNEYVGYGWIVGISDNLIFFPASDSSNYPSILHFMNQEERYGLYINNNIYFSPENRENNKFIWSSIKIELESGEESDLFIVPVIAYYKWENFEFRGMNMYKFWHGKDKMNIIFYFPKSLNLQFIPL